MGTFKAKFTLTSTTGNTFIASGVGDDKEHGYAPLAGLNNTGSITFTLLGDCFFLDGSSTGISFEGLPAGFNVDGVVALTTPNSGVPTNKFNIGFVALSAAGGGSAQEVLRWNALPVTIVNLNNSTPVSFDQENITIDTLNALLDPLIIDCDATSGPVEVAVCVVCDIIYVEGNYAIQSSVGDNPNNTTNPAVFQAGVDNVTITSPNPPDLTTVTSIQIVNSDNVTVATIPSSDFLIWVTLTIKFLLPSLPTVGPWVPGFYVLIGTTFSGSVTLGVLYILIENGSGVYRIISGQTHDTLYINAPDNNQTMDFKIPNPYFKSGFIGG